MTRDARHSYPARNCKSRTRKKFILLVPLALFLFSSLLSAQSTHWTGTSNIWMNPGSWDKGVPTDTSCSIISVGSPATIDPVVPAPSGSDTARTGDLLVQSGGKLHFSDSPFGCLIVNGTIKLQNNGYIYLGSGEIIFKEKAVMLRGGTFGADSGTVTLEGSSWDIKSGATFDPGSSTAVFDGTSNQTLSGNITFNNLVINTPDTVTLSGNVNVAGNLTIGPGVVVIIPPGDTLHVSGTIMNNGTLQGNFTGVLPVEMVSLSAAETKNGVELRWSTATETNNFGFEIERSGVTATSANRIWSGIGFVSGSGTSGALHAYSFVDRHPSPGLNDYRIKQIDTDGTFKYAQHVQVEVGLAPKVFDLSQNYPNPFNPSTEIKFTVGATARTVVDVYNLIGQRVAVLFDRVAQPGQYYRATFNGANLPSGLYFVRLQSGNLVTTRKMTMVK